MNSSKHIRPSFFNRISSNSSLVWGVVTVVTVLAFAVIGAYAKRYMDRDFIGEKSKFLLQCREKPDVNRQQCEELLMARGEIKQPRYSKTMRGPQRPPFLLSDSNADLTPPAQ